MISDIELMVKNIGVYSIVIGCLTKDNEIDIETNKKLILYARKLNKNIQVTFHMAFDEIKNIENDYQKNIDILINLGVNRILTKGCKTNALDGKENIKKYVEYANNRIIIMPGKSVTDENFQELVNYTGCTEVHGTKIIGSLE